jgi:SAM-dependent methyltransferase
MIERMKPDKRDEARIRAHRISSAALERGEATAWFDELYRAAGEDASKVPWADQQPNRWLVEWLDHQVISPKGAAAVVCGCGLGDDAEELASRGYDVGAFDISPAAIDWARRRFPETSVAYRVADLFDLPSSMNAGFDFVFEAYTIQALPAPIRDVAIAAVASLVAPGGELLGVMRGGEPEEQVDGPPWPVTRPQLAGFEEAGLLLDTFDDFMDGAIRRWRVHYVRPSA